MPEPGKSEILKWVRAASAVSTLCMSQEALRQSIDVLHACLDTYDLEVWLILHEWDTCTASVKELEEVLAAEDSMDNKAEMGKEKAQYDVKRVMMARQEVVEEEDKDGGKGEGESEEEEEEDEPVHGPGLSTKVQGKCPAK